VAPDDVVDLVDRFTATGQLRYLDRAIVLMRLSGDAGLPHLGGALLKRYEVSGVRDDLEEGLAALRRVAIERGATLDQVAWLMTAYRHKGMPDTAINIARFALAHAPIGDPDRWRVHHLLGLSLRERFDSGGDPADLDAAIEAHRTAGQQAAGEAVVHRMNLIAALRTRFELTGDVADLDEAIAAADESNGVMLHQEGVLRRYRFERRGDQADADGSIRLLRAAVAAKGEGDRETGPQAGVHLWPGPDPGDPQIRGDSLAAALLRSFQWTGELAELDEAITAQRQSVARTPPGDPELKGRRHNLAVALWYRYEHVGDLPALREAVGILRDIGENASLSATLMALYWRTRDPGLADEAVESAKDPHTRANALRVRFDARNRPEDIRQALGLLDEILRDTPHGSPDHARCLGNIAGAWGQLADRGDPRAPGRVVAYLGRAVRAEAVPEPDRSSYQARFGAALLRQFEISGDRGILTRAARAFEAAAVLSGADPLTRVLAASDWSHAAAELGDPVTADEAAALATELIPYVSSRRLARADQEHGLTRLTGVAADAAACALDRGDAEQALVRLELGRGVLLGQVLESRAAVPAAHADDWARIEAALSADDLPGDRRHELAAERDALLARIRARAPDFLAAPRAGTLRQKARNGPIVLVNVGRRRCDAIIVGPESVDTVRLPGLTLDAAHERAARLARAVGAAGRPGDGERDAQTVVRDTLDWLRRTVTGPVLDHLGDVERLWWSPGGPLSWLPLHASVLDDVISSYTPTVRALDGRAAAPGDRRMLLVAMPETAGAAPLPGAAREVAAIRDLWPADELIGAAATRDAVLGALAGHPTVHFACHAVGDPAEPSGGRLLVHDHQERPLTLRDVSRLRLPAAQLAVLSACHTARGAAALPDEALHVAGAFQLAGFRSVVGTLWQVNDRIASRVAADFHRVRAGRDTAAALHAATIELRDAYSKTPSLWASYVHYGEP
jgi:hypothetical protein